MLADVIGRSNLGHFPQGTIASDLAARFGGFATDFLVAKCHERDYVILLPEWVRPENLICNSLIRLSHCRLQCYSWEPYRHVSRSRLEYKLWIKIVSLPFECWLASCVSAMVHGFGRFLRADTNSVNMVDLTGFRCLIAVDDPAEIPEHLSISMGDLIVSTAVRIESTVPFGGEHRGIPFAGGDASECGDQSDPQGRSLARRFPIPGAADGGEDSREGNRSGDNISWNSSEIKDRRRTVSGVWRAARSTGACSEKKASPVCIGVMAAASAGPLRAWGNLDAPWAARDVRSSRVRAPRASPAASFG